MVETARHDQQCGYEAAVAVSAVDCQAPVAVAAATRPTRASSNAVSRRVRPRTNVLVTAVVLQRRVKTPPMAAWRWSCHASMTAAATSSRSG